MPPQVLSTQLKVSVGGSALPTWLEQALVSWEVVDNRSTPDSFLLRFSDPYHKVLDGDELKIGKQIDLGVQVSGSSSPNPLLAGEITAVELEYSAQRVLAVVRGLDASHRLFRGRRTESYEGQQVPQIVEAVAGRAGLSVADSSDIPQGGTHVAVNQTAESDAAFLNRLAVQVGARWWVVERKLYFKPLQPPQDAPSESTPPEDNPLVLDPDHGLISLVASATSAGQVRQVQVPGWDPVRKQAVLGQADVEHPGVEVDGMTPAELADSFDTETPPLVYSGMVCVSQEEADAAAQSIATQLASGFAELDGTSTGNPDLRAGVAVAVGTNVRRFAGKYVLTGTRHYQNPRGTYLTDFVASGWTDRSLYGMIHDPAGPSGSAANVMIGQVKNIDDPDSLGRVRVNLPGIGPNHLSDWLPVMYPGAGNAAGIVAPLAVDAQVVAAVPAGNPDAAFVLGGLHNQTDVLPQLPQGVEFHDVNTGEVQGFCITTPGGAQLAIVNSSDAKLIRLATSDNKHFIEIDETNSKITISSEGQIAMTGKQGITIDGGSGKVEIKTSGAVEVKGMGVKVDAGGGTAQVSGSSVQLG